MNKKVDTKKLALFGLLTALVVVITPLNIPVGALSMSMAMIPVAIAAIALGPVGGAVIGAVWGVCSFLQCFAGILGVSPMGVFTFEISPVLTFVQRFVPRLLDGLLLGYIFKGIKKASNVHVACLVTGFCSAFLNTVFFMTALVLLFGNTEYMQNMIGGQNVILFICGFVGINAVFEMIASTIITGAVGSALYKAKLY
jgi:uncharacterized membrane protein